MTSRKFVAGAGCALALVLLGGCNRSDSKDDGSAPQLANNGVPVGAPQQSPPPPSPAETVPGSATPAPVREAIPAAFQGRWGLVQGDCGPDASIAKGLMVVDGEKLRFYESVGKPVMLKAPTPFRLEGRFGFSGEGMDWTKQMTLELADNGARLVRTENDPVASYSYRRCPG